MKLSFAAMALAGVLAAPASAELDTRPAARVHVRYVDGIPMRFSSKLAEVVELNFTMSFDHPQGRATIESMLDRIASDYGLGGANAFTVKKFVGLRRETATMLPNPMFTLDDLQAADVIVINNVSSMDYLPERSAAAASAFETAVRGGKSMLGFHSSAEKGRGWEFYDEEVLPVAYQLHYNQLVVPVYRNASEEKHIVLQDVLDSGTTPMEVPMGVDSSGKEILKPNVPIRQTRNEMYAFGRNILGDSIHAPRTTCLLRYDARLSGLPADYTFKGGNPYSFILKMGAGKSAYIHAGHDNTELITGRNSLDGGVGDFERYYAQMLFFLAGYKTEPCGGAVDCPGLPIVDSLDHLTGAVFGSTSIRPRADGDFSPNSAGPRQGSLSDLRGRTVPDRSGSETGARIRSTIVFPASVP